jgi:hypothetical protein
MYVAQALARIADPRGKAALEAWAARQTDRMRKDDGKAFLALFAAQNAKDPAKALLDLLAERGRWSDSIWLEIALADLADDARLAALAKADYEDHFRALIESARKRK